MIKLPTFEDFLKESFADHFNKNVWQIIKKSDLNKKYPELPEEFFNLIDIAYKYIGGHLNIKSASDLMNDYEMQYIEAIDLDSDDESDLVVFGKQTPFGIKLTAVGHDNSKESKKEYLRKTVHDLSKKGFYTEASEKIGEIFISKKVHIVEDENIVKQVLSGKDICWIGEIDGMEGNGWYTRRIGNKEVEKIMFGFPDV